MVASVKKALGHQYDAEIDQLNNALQDQNAGICAPAQYKANCEAWNNVEARSISGLHEMIESGFMSKMMEEDWKMLHPGRV